MIRLFVSMLFTKKARLSKFHFFFNYYAKLKPGVFSGFFVDEKMPELPEVEVTLRGIAGVLEDAVISRVKVNNFFLREKTLYILVLHL